MEASLGYTVRQKPTKFTFLFEMTFWSDFWLWKHHGDFYGDLIYFVVFEISKMSLRWKQINMDKPEFPDKWVIFHSRTWYWHGICDLGVLEQGKNSEGKQCLKGLNKYMAWICLKHIWNTWYWLLRKSPEVAGRGRCRPMIDKRYGIFRPKVTRNL